MRFLGKITKTISSTNIAYPQSRLFVFLSLFRPFCPCFFTELRVEGSKTEQPRKIVIIKHRIFASFSFFAFLRPLGHLCSRDTSIQGTLNLVPENSSHNICNCYL